MQYKINWLVEEHLSFTPCWGNITAADLNDFDAELLTAMDRSTKPLVHNIYDYSLVNSIPAIKDYMALKAGKHPRTGWVIFTGLSNPLVRFVISAIVQMFGLRLRIMNSNREALDFICDMDATLPPLGALDLDAMRDSMANSAVPLS